MKKKNLLFAGIMIFLLFAINQLAMAQIYPTCSANKVLMSIGCACHCNSKCVNPNQVDQMLKKGWNLGGCTSFDCCPVLKSDSNTSNSDTVDAVIAQALPKCKCNLPDAGCGNNRKCLDRCTALCSPVSGATNILDVLLASLDKEGELLYPFEFPESQMKTISNENILNGDLSLVWKQTDKGRNSFSKLLNNSKSTIDSTDVSKVSSVSVAPKCNCNCSLPNYGLSKAQLKNCLGYCYRICELGW